jgi:8-oxo-dGTP pyrophosphatase MutT (NUDIX family)
MKLTFAPPNDGVAHSYCFYCRQETLQAFEASGIHQFYCYSCHHTNLRALIIDPKVVWWTDDSDEYWHEVAGVFAAKPDGTFLFFDRTKYPLGGTIPAGHSDVGEHSIVTAKRELHEETGINANVLTPIATDDVWGDECRRGADVHRWHSFVTKVPQHITADIRDEGVGPLWLTLDQALACNLTHVTRYVITHHYDEILAAAR